MATVVDKTAAGAWTWTAPFDCVARITGIGGGGGADGGATLSRGSGGGGGGALSEILVVAFAGDVFTGNVGAAGAGSAHNATTATNGTATTAIRSGVTLLSAAPGSRSSAATGGAGGTAAASVGTVKVSGANGTSSASGSAGVGGAAGSNANLTGGGSQATARTAGNPPGGGGGGDGNSAGAGGGAGSIGKLRISYDALLEPNTGRYGTQYNSAGAAQWIAEASGEVLMMALAGGGGGRGGTALSSGGPGGGGGGLSYSVISVTKGQLYDITVGSGGTAGAYGGNPGGNGTDTTIALNGTVLVRAKPGQGAVSSTIGAGGTTTGATGDVKIAGYAGGAPPVASMFNMGTGGPAARPLGGGSSGDGGQAAGSDGTAPGGGGSGGGANTGGNGGAGAAGCAKIAYISTAGSAVIAGERRPLVAISTIQSGAKVPLKVSRIVSGAKSRMQLLYEDPTARYLDSPVWLDAPDRFVYNRELGTFNWDVGASHLMAALASGTCDIICVGDSLTEGFTYLNDQVPFNSTADRINAFVHKMRAKLTADYPIAFGGTGLVRAQGVLGPDPRWVHNSGSSAVHYQAYAANEFGTFTSTTNGTQVAVSYIDTAGTLEIAVDGATSGAGFATVVGTNTGTLMRRVLTGLSNATHAVRTKSLSGTCAVVGAEVGYATGIRTHNLGQGGSTVAGSGQAAWQDTALTNGNMLPVYEQQTGLIGRNADAVFIMLGGNDMGGTSTKPYATMETAITKVGDHFDTSTTDIILLTEPHGSIRFATPKGYSEEWYARQLDLALTKGWAVLDTEYLTGGFEYLAGLGYTGDIYGHFNSGGATYVGELCATAILGEV